MTILQDQSVPVESNKFLAHFIATRNWLEERLAGEPHDIWFTPRGMVGSDAVKLELTAVGKMIDHIHSEIDAEQSLEDILSSARKFSTVERKKALSTVAEDMTPHVTLASIYQRMYLTLGIL